MNNAITFFVGCFTLVSMMFIKIPIKKITARLAARMQHDVENRHSLYKRLNTVIQFVVIIFSLICYYFVLKLLGETHFKLCCCMKAGAIAIALYAVFEQWFGEDFRVL